MEAVGKEAALADVLRGRDERAQLQRQLLAEYGRALVSFTVNMPGPRKLCAESRYIHARGVRQLEQALLVAGARTLYTFARKQISGPEAYFVVDMPAAALKELTCAVEDASPLGRLFDMDVLDPDTCVPLSRESAGLARRGCLICGGDAAVCARTRAHAIHELEARINALVEQDRCETEKRSEA